MKKKREKPTCGYCKGSHHEIYFFRNNIDILTKLLEENNIDVPYFARRWECKQEDGRHVHALCAWEKTISHISISYVFVSDLHSDISESETSIHSLEETSTSSPNIPKKTSQFLLVPDVSYESSFPFHSDPSYCDSEGDIHAGIHPIIFINSFPQPFDSQKTRHPPIH